MAFDLGSLLKNIIGNFNKPVTAQGVGSGNLLQASGNAMGLLTGLNPLQTQFSNTPGPMSSPRSTPGLSTGFINQSRPSYDIWGNVMSPNPTSNVASTTSSGGAGATGGGGGGGKTITNDQAMQMGLDVNNLPAGYKMAGATGSSNAINNPLDFARQALQMQVQANQPAIQALQASVDPLKQSYSDLIASIKQNQGVAENKQTNITNNELGARGLLGSSTLAQQEIQNAVTPVTAQFSGIESQAGLSRTQDLAKIAQQIAALSSGNPESAINAGLQFGGLQNTAMQLAAQIANQQANQAIARGQLGISGGNLALQQALAGFNPQTGQIVNPLSVLLGAGGNATGNTGSQYLYNSP